MFEITYGDKETLEYYIREQLAYPNAEYDFTFENRFLIYHAPIRNAYVYLVLDMETKLTSEAYHSSKPLKQLNHRNFVPRILQAIKYTGDRRYINNIYSKPLEIIDAIFRKVMPEYGFNVREEQIELCKRMYMGFTTYTASICEAEVGTGKSLAYLVAAVIARKCNGIYDPITISTSNIELQKALIEKDIPRLSHILMDYELISKPLTATLRKGKEHYFCKFRYEDFVKTLNMYPDKHKTLLDYFHNTQFSITAFDLDSSKLPASIKDKICVKGMCTKCRYRNECKYNRYVDAAKKSYNLVFQVTNHNLFLASEKLRINNKPPVLVPSRLVIIDEAHKLKEAASDTYGERLFEKDVQKYVNQVRNLCADENKHREFKHLIQKAAATNSDLFDLVKQVISEEDRDEDKDSIFYITPAMQAKMRELKGIISSIESAREKAAGGYGIIGERIVHSLSILMKPHAIISWASVDDNGKITIQCCPKYIGGELFKQLWSNSSHYILTSGTMSDGKDFSYFKQEHGLTLLKSTKTQISSSPSPFNYQKNTRLYIPQDMPAPNNNDEDYIKALSEQIIQLVKATNGHTAILFTSYKVLHAVYELTKDSLGEFELICMTRGNKTAISEFKKSKNAVLFASGSMWEGVDCIGDCLSSVIIVRLPFPIRSATMEEKKSASQNVSAFIDQYAVPEMLIKLRQGVGRLVRCETDTGLISILDARAAHSKYADRIQSVLSKHPRVDSIEEIETFFKEIKPAEYFNK